MAASPLFEFGLPSDAPTWLAGGAGVALLGSLLLPRLALALARAAAARSRSVIAATAALAALCSLGYFHFYLGGQPRIIDATAYLLEARSLAEGHFTFAVPEPSALFRGRFLLVSEASAWARGHLPLRLGVIFPPGYPLILALGERLGSYAIIGPFLAALLVLVTAALGREFSGRRSVGVLSGIFSLLCVCLRYHTADTMSHGWSAVLGSTFVWLALRAERRASHRRWELVAMGVCVGWLLATRQLTGLCFLVAVLGWWTLGYWRLGTERRVGVLSRRVLWVALGATPGIVLLLAQQWALTGSVWGSPQLRYYALSDGPAGCFGLGFGKGCWFEHGPTVRAQGGGLGPYWALRNTLNRLHAHSLDIANFEPLALVVLWGALRARAERPVRLALFLGVTLIVAYAAFYFDGSYPGGGARFLAELLPLEHAGLATLLVRWSEARSRTGKSPTTPLAAALAVSLFGFACHGSLSHAHLRDHQEGPGTLAQAPGPELLFVGSDHAFLNYFDPGALPTHLPGIGPHDAPSELRGRLVARGGDDARETALWANLGRPQAFRLRGPRTGTPARLEPWTPPASDARRAPTDAPPSSTPTAGEQPRVVEVEQEWPLLEARGVWAHPAYPPGSCVSRGRALLLHPSAAMSHLWIDVAWLPAGNYAATAVYWTPERECFEEALGQVNAPTWLDVHFSATQPRYLDRVELVRVE